MLVPLGPEAECVSVIGAAVKLGPCAVNVTGKTRRQAPTTQLWRIDSVRNTILSAAAATASSGCLVPNGAPAPSTLVGLGSCTGPDASWAPSATPPVPPPAPPATGLSGGAIAGIVIGSLAGAGLIAGGGYGIYKAQQKKTEAAGLKDVDFPMESAAPLAMDAPSNIESAYEKVAPAPVNPVYNASAPVSDVGSSTVVGATAGAASSSMEGLCTVVRAYNPKYADELELRPGDLVRVEESFPDVRTSKPLGLTSKGWARGVNQTTKLSGVFPLNFVVKQ
jgi:hypothetical protein